jgi:hypothetical protein
MLSPFLPVTHKKFNNGKVMRTYTTNLGLLSALLLMINAILFVKVTFLPWHATLQELLAPPQIESKARQLIINGTKYPVQDVMPRVAVAKTAFDAHSHAVIFLFNIVALIIYQILNLAYLGRIIKLLDLAPYIITYAIIGCFYFYISLSLCQLIYYAAFPMKAQLYITYQLKSTNHISNFPLKLSTRLIGK